MYPAPPVTSTFTGTRVEERPRGSRRDGPRRGGQPRRHGGSGQVVTADEVREVALALPRTSEHLIRDHVKFRVGKIVYVSISPDESTMGFGFPREERAALVAAEPEKFALPRPSDQRFHWVHVQMAAIDITEMRELVTDAWRMVVPKRVAAAHLGPGGR